MDSEQTPRAPNFEILKKHVTSAGPALLKELGTAIEDAKTDLDTLIETKIYPGLDEAVTKAETESIAALKEWSRSKSLHWNTYKSIVSSDGVYDNKKGKTYDVNEMMAAPMLRPITRMWNQVLVQHIKDSRVDMADRVSRKYRNLARLPSLGFSETKANVWAQVVRGTAEPSFKNIELVLGMESLKLNLSTTLRDEIQKAMKPGYEEASKQKGDGTLERIRRCVENQADDISKHVFKNAAAVLKKQLRTISVEFESQLQKLVPDAVRKVESILTEACNTDDDHDDKDTASKLSVKAKVEDTSRPLQNPGTEAASHGSRDRVAAIPGPPRPSSGSVPPSGQSLGTIAGSFSSALRVATGPVLPSGRSSSSTSSSPNGTVCSNGAGSRNAASTPAMPAATRNTQCSGAPPQTRLLGERVACPNLNLRDIQW